MAKQIVVSPYKISIFTSFILFYRTSMFLNKKTAYPFKGKAVFILFFT